MAFFEALARWLLPPPAARDTLGARGERAAERFLRRLGYRVIGRNWRCDGGEVDLIARDGRWLVFVEVKTRQADQRVRPEEQVHAHKQGRLRHAAAVYAARFRSDPPPVRFDVVSVVWPDGAAKPTAIRHEKHAFE